MKKKLIYTIASLYVMASLLMAGGCSQKKIQSEVVPPSPPVTATIQPVDKTGQELSSQTQIKTITATDIDESKPQVESLETTPDQNAALAGQAYPIGEGRSSVSMLPIYFDFDRSNIKDDQLARIQSNAAVMKKQDNIKVRIEGNCDERGTNEYNMALGERRAMAAKKFMMDMGIEDLRLETLSYGEERPLTPGHDETSWAQNRRGDFVILN